MNPATASRAEQSALRISVIGALFVGVNGVTFSVLTGAEAILLDGLFNLTYFVTGLLTIKVSKLVARGENDDFPVGYAFFEPLVNGGKGILMLGVTLMALISAVEALFAGGRPIVLGLAVVYGVLTSVICWSVALWIRALSNRTGSPLVEADAKNWIVNAAISSAVLGTLLVVFAIRNTSLRFLVPYVDPVLVLIVCSVTIMVPIRMSWSALMELVNRTPSPQVLASVRKITEKTLANLPVTKTSVRVLQPGRTRIISIHVLLSSEVEGGILALDAARNRTDRALHEEYPMSVLDIVFTRDPKWSAPLEKPGKRR